MSNKKSNLAKFSAFVISWQNKKATKTLKHKNDQKTDSKIT